MNTEERGQTFRSKTSGIKHMITKGKESGPTQLASYGGGPTFSFSQHMQVASHQQHLRHL